MILVIFCEPCFVKIILDLKGKKLILSIQFFCMKFLSLIRSLGLSLHEAHRFRNVFINHYVYISHGPAKCTGCFFIFLPQFQYQKVNRHAANHGLSFSTRIILKQQLLGGFLFGTEWGCSNLVAIYF